jgi:ribosomal protein S18 acetylase RimI-like enzyme
MATAVSGAASDRLIARPTRDRQTLYPFLSQDRLYAAYAIADMDDREFGRTRWGVALRHGATVAVCMEYSGLSPQPLFVMGDPAGVRTILGSVIRTRTAYLAAMPEHLPAVSGLYRVEPGPRMVRMWVDRATFRPVVGEAVRLDAGDTRHLNRLYELGLTAWLPSESVSSGVYYGVRRGGRLVAAAGTHVISPTYGLAAVGNVFTHRDMRGRGFAKAVTSAVTAELLETVATVVLNVRSDNAPALAAYRALGYQAHTSFEERLVRREGSLWDSIVAPFRRYLPDRTRTR